MAASPKQPSRRPQQRLTCPNKQASASKFVQASNCSEAHKSKWRVTAPCMHTHVLGLLHAALSAAFPGSSPRSSATSAQPSSHCCAVVTHHVALGVAEN